MWFDSWGDTARVASVGVAIYVYLVIMLRVSGKRTLSKLNAFDLVVTVALGSSVSSILLSSSVSFVEGAIALTLLAALQYAVAALNARFGVAERVSKSAPAMLVRDGRFLDEVLVEERVTRADVRQAIRSHGHGAIEEVAVVVLESDGSFSVITSGSVGSGTALEDVRQPTRGG